MHAHLFGIQFQTMSFGDALNAIDNSLQYSQQNMFFINAHCANVALTNPHYRDALHHADIMFPDGAGVELACKLTEQPMLDNLNGTDLFPKMCLQFAQTQKSVFLLGGSSGTAEKVKEWILKHYPQINVVGTHHGHFTEEQSLSVIQAINHAQPDVLFVAMGVPRQEIWLHKNRSQLNTKLNVAVGGLFEFYSGNIPRASSTIRKLKMEWLWRLWQEPKRLWRRYILGTLAYLWRIMIEAINKTVSKRLVLNRFSNTNRAYLLLAQNVKCRLHQFRIWQDNVLKRLFDITLSSLALTLLLPFFPLVALAMKLDSPGPLFFVKSESGKVANIFLCSNCGQWSSMQNNSKLS